MKIFYLLLFLMPVFVTAQATEEMPFTTLTNTTGIPSPPALNILPTLEVVSSIISSSNTLEDIKNQFPEAPIYEGDSAFYPPPNALGVWIRFYTQTTSLFNILAVSEEIIYVETNGNTFWLQNVKTKDTMNSSSHRKLQLTYYNLFDHMFFVFHYADQDPANQDVRDKQGFFVRILTDRRYMQMSTSPNFEPEKSMYWRQLPNYQKTQLVLP